ncbi:MAG: nucleotidyltransferase domain-containing protein [Bacteroidales bacterium]|nr:nucleotidyltransferase domain-containing protein [Bacteroidales bacterium]
MTDSQLNQFGLTQRDMDTISSILFEYPEITEVHIFGSRAKGNRKPGSDIDLAIVNTGVSERTIRHLKADFEDSSLPYKVDIVDINETIHPELKEHVQRVGVAFYKKSE